MKIVVIEDEIRIREGICKLIKKINPEYVIAGQADNGKVGLEIILNEKPDLVITDIKMPIMDGLDMLKRLQEKKRGTKTIVLSAYSEFEYAQQAILLGVSEFLIKPISVDALTQALSRIEKQYEYENKTNPDILNSLESIFKGILFGGIDVDNNLLGYLEGKFNLYSDTTFAQIYLYFGKDSNRLKKETNKEMVQVLNKINQLEFHIINTPDNKGEIIVVHGFDTEGRLVDVLYKTIVGFRKYKQNTNLNIGWSVLEGVKNLKPVNDELFQSMEWGIALGNDLVIDPSKLDAIHTMPSCYPIKVENDIKASLCAYDFQKSQYLINEFIAYYRDKIYEPKEIKADYIRFIWAITNISKQIGIIDYEKLNTQRVIENINDAKQYPCLEKELQAVFDLVKTLVNTMELTTSLTVNRAKSLIHEFYHTGISVDEIANKLNITPEYLSTLFRDKTGTNFTTYLRNYRINKAKELLIGTQLKLYEVAEKVGYSDPKYFSRVFRKCIGQLSAEYRRMNR